MIDFDEAERNWESRTLSDHTDPRCACAKDHRKMGELGIDCECKCHDGEKYNEDEEDR